MDQAVEGEVDGQTDMENRPKLALTKWREVPLGQERERVEPSQANTFIRLLAPPRKGSNRLPAVMLAMESRRNSGTAMMHNFLLLLPPFLSSLPENLSYGRCYSQLRPRRLSATD